MEIGWIIDALSFEKEPNFSILLFIVIKLMAAIWFVYMGSTKYLIWFDWEKIILLPIIVTILWGFAHNKYDFLKI
jgi:hypothetical protein